MNPQDLLLLPRDLLLLASPRRPMEAALLFLLLGLAMSWCQTAPCVSAAAVLRGLENALPL